MSARRGHASEGNIGRTCQDCAHFVDDPGSIEAEIPYLRVFGSAYSSARGHAGICRELDRFLDPVPAEYCPSFAPRDAAPPMRSEPGHGC